jgi:putative endonuclease
MPRAFYVYILASQRNGTLYIGVTNDIARRIWEHREGLGSSFTRRYHVKMLVHLETYDSISLAIQRETNLKRWLRRWKLALIEQNNPNWDDLTENLV